MGYDISQLGWDSYEEDYWGSSYEDEYDGGYGCCTRSSKSCKHCGKGNLEWQQINDRWALWDPEANAVHVCAKTCKYCGKPGQEWQHLGGRWILWDSRLGVPHECPKPKVEDELDFGSLL